MTENIENTTGPKYIAKTIGGLEEVLAGELRNLGAGEVEVLNRAVSFTGDMAMVYKANYHCRTALRILVPLTTFQLADEDDLYLNVFNYEWEKIMDVKESFAIDAVVSDSPFTHSHYVSLRTKDAIADRFRRNNNGRRPSVDTDNPDFRINVHIHGNSCDLLLDSSGASLHKRGYRAGNAEAPMSEVLAAGLILLSGWDRKSNFVDPMCGSGTLVIEAALIANNIPPGQYRKDYGFMHWHDFDRELWEQLVSEAIDQQEEFEHRIIGCDISPKNLGVARANVKAAKLHKDIELHVVPMAAFTPPDERGIVVMNPPYGERIRTQDISGLYASIGDTLKNNYQGYKAWIISSDRIAMKHIGLKTSRRFTVWNGPLECMFAGYDLYKGSQKVKYKQGSTKDNGFSGEAGRSADNARTGLGQHTPDRQENPGEKRRDERIHSERKFRDTQKNKKDTKRQQSGFEGFSGDGFED